MMRWKPENEIARGTMLPAFRVIEQVVTGRVLERWSKPAPACPVCDDAGFIQPDRNFAIQLPGNPPGLAYVEFPYRVACCHCREGLEQIFQWQQDTGCRHCCYGVPLEREGFFHFCLRCRAGLGLQDELDRLVANRTQAVLDKLVADAGVPMLLRSQTFENFQTIGPNIDPADAFQVAQAKRLVMAAAIASRSIYLGGECGIGKTHLSAAYLNYAYAHGRTGMFVSILVVLNTLYQSLDRAEGQPNWATILDRFVNADILVLDDVGQEKVTEKSNEVLFQLLNARIVAGKATVVSSNYSPKELKARGYSAAIVSRLGGFEQIFWDVEDWRLK